METTNNYAMLRGEITEDPKISHSLLDETFYVFPIKVKRLSGSCDIINVTLSEKLLNFANTSKGSYVQATGQYRSYNNYSGIGNKLILTLFAQDLVNIDESALETDANSIFLNGYICKPVIYRTTPFGREIADIILATNRAYGKSDYIPCIAWGRNAKYASTLSVGDNIEISGRIQSREYQKKLSEEEIVTKTAFEISISKIELINCKENNVSAE